MTYYIDYSKDNIDWKDYCSVEGDLSLETALSYAQELADQGYYVNVWNCADNCVWNQGRRVARVRSLMEQDWESAGLPVFPVLLDEVAND